MAIASLSIANDNQVKLNLTLVDSTNIIIIPNTAVFGPTKLIGTITTILSPVLYRRDEKKGRFLNLDF